MIEPRTFKLYYQVFDEHHKVVYNSLDDNLLFDNNEEARTHADLKIKDLNLNPNLTRVVPQPEFKKP